MSPSVYNSRKKEKKMKQLLWNLVKVRFGYKPAAVLTRIFIYSVQNDFYFYQGGVLRRIKACMDFLYTVE